MRSRQTDFSTGNVYRNIMEVAFPMILAQMINLLYNIVDRIYIGRIPGTGRLALTGVGLCFPIITLVTAFTQLYGNGGSPLCAMERGRGNLQEAENLMGNSFTLLVATGFVLLILGSVFYEPVLYAFGASSDTFPYASAYIRIYLTGTVFVMISLGMNPFINSQGFARTGMLTVLIGAVLNIFLDPLLIFGLGMGVEGAAIATVFSQFCSAAWVLRFLTGGRSELHLKKSSMKLSGSRVVSIVSLGVSGFVMAFTNSLVQVVCNTTLEFWGGDIYVGVMTVLNSIREIFSMPIMGLVNGASPVMSFNYGGKDYIRVKKAIRFVAFIGLIFTSSVWLLLRVLPEPFIRIFNSDPEMLEKGIPALHIYFFGFCFMVFQFTGQATFVALGKAKRATFFSLLRKAFIVVPLTILLPHVGNLGVNGVFWAEPISNVVGGCACFFTMLKTLMPELSGKKQ